MATHSSILAWEIPWTEEPGGLQSMGSERVRGNWVTEHTHSWFTVESYCLVTKLKKKPKGGDAFMVFPPLLSSIYLEFKWLSGFTMVPAPADNELNAWGLWWSWCLQAAEKSGQGVWLGG